MRRWLTIASLVVLPWLSGCCCHLSPCGERLFNRPCLFGKCNRGCDSCGGGGVYTGAAYYGGAPSAGCPSCGGGAPAPGGAPVYPGTTGAIPAPMPNVGPAVGAPPIEKLTAVPPAQTVPTRIIR